MKLNRINILLLLILFFSFEDCMNIKKSRLVISKQIHSDTGVIAILHSLQFYNLSRILFL